MTFAIITVLVGYALPMAGVFIATVAEGRARSKELPDES